MSTKQHISPFVFLCFILVTVSFSKSLLTTTGAPHFTENTKSADLNLNQTRALTGNQNNFQSSIIENSQNVESMGYFGTAVNAAAFQGNYAYVGEGAVLTILDVSNPDLPQVLGKTVPLPGSIADIVVNGEYAYTANRSGGLRIIHIADPTTPTEVGFFESQEYYNNFSSVAISGNYAFVTDSDRGLRIIDISNPAVPNEVGYYFHYSWFSDTYAYDVVVDGNYAYVADFFAMHIINITNIADPVLTTYFNTGAFTLSKVGNLVYIAAGSAGLRVIDVSNVSEPTEIGFYDTEDAHRLAIEGNYAYLVDGYPWVDERKILIIDISNPNDPMEISSYDPGMSFWSVASSGNHVYVMGRGGLRIIDTIIPEMPVEVGIYSTPSAVSGIDVTGNYAYVAAGSDGLHIIDITNPAIPTMINTHYTPGWAHRVVINGNYAYITIQEGGVRIVDISNPIEPSVVGFIDINSYYNPLFEEYLYLPQGHRLSIIDVVNPAHPIELGSYDPPYGINVFSVKVVANYAYIAAGEGGLRIIDISNPIIPVEVGAYETSDIDAISVDVAGVYAYTAEEGGGLRIINVADPTDPIEVSFFEFSQDALDVSVVGNLAYVAVENIGLSVIDISNPAFPIEVGYYESPNSYSGLWQLITSGNHIYLAGEGAMFTLRYSGEINKGRILVDKMTNPSGDPQAFDFTLTNLSNNNEFDFQLTDEADPWDSGNLEPGNYALEEVVPSEWMLSVATCDDGSDPNTIQLDYGETVICTFTNVKPGRIIVDNQTNPSSDPQPFAFTLTDMSNNNQIDFQLTDETDPWDSGNLEPGNYALEEVVPSGWVLSAATCNDGSDPNNMQLNSGETVFCVFTNVKLGRIIVDKVTNPSNESQPFLFNLSGGPDALDLEFTLTDAADPWVSGYINSGAYSLTETKLLEWVLIAATCDNGNDPANIQLGSGDMITCTFINRKRSVFLPLIMSRG